jgi:two-component system OmpR family response regulator
MIRARNEGVPIVVLSSRGDEAGKVQALDFGADDYVTKPFELRELVARIKAVLRRTELGTAPAPAVQPQTAKRCLRFMDWILDLDARLLSDIAGREVVLTGGEFDLLMTFATNPGRVLSRDFLIGRTRGREAGPFDRTIDVQVGRLRKKLEADPEAPQIIKSVRGAGYVLVVPVQPFDRHA